MLSHLAELFSYPFMLRAMAVGVAVSCLCGVLGVFVVLRGLSFIGAGISHSALAGVAIALVLGISPMLGASVFCALLALLIAALTVSGKIKEDAVIGILLTGSMAGAILLIHVSAKEGMDLMGYLFGSILLVDNSELVAIILSALGLLLCIVLLYKELMLMVFDRVQCRLSGINVSVLYPSFLVIVSLTVVLTVKVAGIILSMSLIIAPAATALRITQDFNRAVAYSAALGVCCTAAGLALSFFADLPPGASIAFIFALCFLCVSLTVQLLGRSNC